MPTGQTPDPISPGPSGSNSSTPGSPTGSAAPAFDWRTLHLWQIQPVRDAFLVIAVVAIFQLGYMLQLVTVPILLAVLLAYLFEPLVQRMTRGRWFSRQGAAVLIIIVSGVVVVVPVTLGASYAFFQGVSLVQELAENTNALQRSIAHPNDALLAERVPDGLWRLIRDRVIELRAAQAAGESLNEGAEPIVRFVDWSLTWLDANAAAVLSQIGRRAIGGGAEAVTALLRTLKSVGVLGFTGFLTAFFFYFFCTGWGRVLAFSQRFIPTQNKSRAFDLLRQMDRVIAGFIRGRLIICMIQCVVFSTGYWIVGVPAPAIVGVVVGILAIVPYAGLLGVPLTLILIWLDPPSGFRSAWWWMTFGPFVVYQFGQMLDDYLLSPTIQGKATDLDTPSILFASLAGGILAGFYGLLLAIPVAACIKILLREVAMPKIRDWVEGRATDPLPLGGEVPRTANTTEP